MTIRISACRWSADSIRAVRRKAFEANNPCVFFPSLLWSMFSCPFTKSAYEDSMVGGATFFPVDSAS